MGSDPSCSEVAILLCTYNGQRYLADQLDSFVSQTHQNWKVWVSDDGSGDGTLALLETYRQNWRAGQMSILAGPRSGVTANFLSLVCNGAINAEYYAYSDQDDIWNPDKLERAVRWLDGVPAVTPALYCSRTRCVDEENNEIGLSPLFTKPASFANALIQNIAGGNTMVINRAARALLREAGANVPAVIHDWWTYLVVTACGGAVHYDRYPSLRYRQHGANLIGIRTGWIARAKRFRQLWGGRLRANVDDNIAAMCTLQGRLTPESRETLDCFVAARKMRLLPRLFYFKHSGVYRQTFLGNLGLATAVLFGRI